MLILNAQKTQFMISSWILPSDEDQLDFPILYGSSRMGFAIYRYECRSGDLKPLFDAIIDHIPAPQEKDDTAYKFLVTNLRSL